MSRGEMTIQNIGILNFLINDTFIDARHLKLFPESFKSQYHHSQKSGKNALSGAAI